MLAALFQLPLAAADPAFNLLAARWQMAITLGAHIILAVFGVAMPVLLLVAEWRYLVTRDREWLMLAHRWSKVFAVLFAVGAVSGTVLSFELGLLWPTFMSRYGPVISFPFAMEGFAFFLEAIFVGIYLYGWKRLSPWAHWWCGVPIALAGVASAWFVVTVNAWMNTPSGFRMEGERVVEIDPFAALFNPATGPETAHMIAAAYMVAGFVIAACYAWCLLREPRSTYYRRAMTLGLVMGCVMAPLQIVVGDQIARHVAEFQPVKLAALEGQFKTEANAPARIGGWPDESIGRTRYAIEIPGMLSWLAYQNRDAVVQGLDDFPSDETPPVAVVHIAFQIMVGIGTLLAGVSLYVLVAGILQRQIPQGRKFLWLVVACGPLSVVALEAGWVVTEVGRQPWIVHGLARTADMVTRAPYAGWMLGISIAIYTVIALGTLRALGLLAMAPDAEDSRA
jgi:cytochrome d ubiquinol oxidase subunit I